MYLNRRIFAFHFNDFEWFIIIFMGIVIVVISVDRTVLSESIDVNSKRSDIGK